jgi:hypothetical protein
MKISRRQLRQLVLEEAGRINEYGGDSHLMIIDRLASALSDLESSANLAANGALDPRDSDELEAIVEQLRTFVQKFD